MAGPTTFAPLAGPASQELRRQIAGLERQLNVLKAQVRQAQQLVGLGTTAMTIAHEMNNLLTPIVGYAQAAVACDDPVFMQKALRITIANVQVVAAMSARVLAMGAATPNEPAAVSVREAISEAVESLCRDLSKDGIRFVCEVPEDLHVLFDPLMLRQVLFNLFINARDAMAQAHSGTLTVRAAFVGERVVLEVSDTGRGIDPGLLPHIFDPLQSTKPARRDGQYRCGGLGLSLCRDLVTEAGGSIEVTSRPHAGTTFVLTLPPADLTTRQSVV